MTLHTILVSGVLKCITELPERPIKSFDAAHYVSARMEYDNALEDYETALESAKNNAIPYEDQDAIEKLISVHCTGWKPMVEGQIYSFEYSGRIEVTEAFSHCTVGEKHYKTVIRLIPESKEESQPLKPVIDFAVWYSGMERHKVINAYNRYLRETRKPLNHGK
jgi:hypothetical protein